MIVTLVSALNAMGADGIVVMTSKPRAVHRSATNLKARIPYRKKE